MPDVAAIKQTVQAYARAVTVGPDEVVGLYTENATVADPVGTPPHVGRDAIHAFYSGNPRPLSCELGEVRVAGDTAAFLLRAVIEVDGNKLQIEPMDVMTFDENAKIVSMRALWSPEDVRPA